MDKINFDIQLEIMDSSYLCLLKKTLFKPKSFFYLLVGIFLSFVIIYLTHVYKGIENSVTQKILIGGLILGAGVILFLWMLFSWFVISIYRSRVHDKKRRSGEIMRFTMDKKGCGYQTESFSIFIQWCRFFKLRENDHYFYLSAHHYFSPMKNIFLEIPKNQLSLETITQIQELISTIHLEKAK